MQQAGRSVPTRRKGPSVSLQPASAVPESVQAAVLAELTPWVKVFRERHPVLWPASGKGPQGPAGSLRRRYPWPDCWTQHPDLVTELHCLKAWTEAIDNGDLTAQAAYGGGFDRWTRHVNEVTAPLVQEIGRVCMAGGVGSHVDMTKPRRREGDRPPTQVRVRFGRAPAESPLVVLGSTGDAAWAAPLPAHWGPVHRLQWMLRKRHGYDLKVDGDPGPSTGAAVKSFQRKAGLVVDGVVGPLTWAKVAGR
jgi:peptidoglycan hydrolase-like protein with peptidoglycan-binding domain